jgi:hypothetical protein
MKKSVYFITLLCFSVFVLSTTVRSQSLTGIKTIPGDYATVELAIAALNANGVGSGGVTFNIAAGYTETFTSPTAGHITATGTSSNPIIFQKSGSGDNPKITAGIGTGTLDGIIVLQGTDYITFDGIDVIENSTNTTNTNRMEWGFALIKKQNTAPFDGCQYIVIKNCSVSLTKSYTSTRGIYAGNHVATSTSALTITHSSDTNSNCEFFNNTITNSYQGICLNGYNAASPYTLYDQNNKIGVPKGNNIYNFGNAGIYFIYQNNIVVSNNTLTESTGPNASIYGIQAEAASGAKVEISGNTITLRNGSISASYIYAISCKSGSNVTGSEIKINGNTIQNCTYNSSTALGFYGISLETAPKVAEIKNNNILNNTVPGGGNLTGIQLTSNPVDAFISDNIISDNNKTGPSGTIFGIKTASGANLTVSGNTLNNNKIENATGDAETRIYGFFNEASLTNLNVQNNSFSNFTIGGNNTYSFKTVTGIFSNGTATNKTISGNNIHSFSLNIGYVYGIYANYGTLTKIHQNRIYNLTTLEGNPTVANNTFSINGTTLKGIFVDNMTECLIYNNYISELKTESAGNVLSIAGINFGQNGTSSRKLYVINNTVMLDASSSGSDFGTAVYLSSTSSSSPLTTFQNNIFVNNSTPNGVGSSSIYFGKRPSNESNRNCYYTASSGHPYYIFRDMNTFFYDDFNYYMLIFDCDDNSFFEMPPFINISVSPYNLHIQEGGISHCESGGMVSVYNSETVNIEDFDGDKRFPDPACPAFAGHPAQAPDIGADEFGGVHLDDVPPTIQYDVLSNTASTDPRTLVATITDDFSGIPLTGVGLPMLYWQKSTTTTPSGSWIGVQGVPLGSNQYSFTFGGGVQDKDYVFYFVAAQDLATIPNVWASVYNSGNETGLTANPPACANPDTYYSYQIVSICGTYTVGVGQDFNRITDAMNYIQDKEITCPVVFLLTDNLYYENFHFSEITGMSAVNTITIKPAAGVTARINAYSPQFAAIMFGDGASHYIIDGSNQTGGSDRNLIIENSAPSQVILLREFSSFTKTIGNNVIKNCIIRGGHSSVPDWPAGIMIPGAIVDGLNIENNEFYQLSSGVVVSGMPGRKINNILISANNFGNESDGISYAGIYAYYADRVDISYNNFRNIKNADDNAAGIDIGTDVTNTNIFGNELTGIAHTGTDGYGGKGIDIHTGNGDSNIMVYNNSISDISGDGWDGLTDDAIVGIRLRGPIGGVNLYHNSVHLFGNVTGTYDDNKSAAFYIGRDATDINLINNIFVNSIDDIAKNAEAFAIYSDAHITAFNEIDNNLYFVAGNEGVLGYLNGNKTDLGEWKTATGKDVNSVSFMPPFVNNTNLRLTASNNAGVYITNIDYDLDGTPRDTSTPDIGAFEKSSNDGTNLISADIENIRIFTVNRKILVRSDLVNSKVAVYNIAGQLIASANIDQGVFSEIPVDMSGIYIISVKSSKGITTTKVLCK